MTLSNLYFAQSYEENREKFRALIEKVRTYWPNAELESNRIADGKDDLATDVILAHPLHEKQRLLLISTGLHGIEGYIGAAIQHLFVDRYLTRLNPQDTGLLLVHAINPWGMKYRRRVNEHNVDLNRNFIYDQNAAGKSVNPAYDKAFSMLNPQRPLKCNCNPFFYPTLINKMLVMGPAVFQEAVLYGQYRHPQGLYYGGQGFEPSALYFNRLFFETISEYPQILLLDMHSGYGPRYQMTLVNSVYEKRSSADLQAKFNYPLVAKTDRQEFYKMQGDMIDYLYQVMQSKYPEKLFFGTSFEFGTYGDSFRSVVRSLRVMIDENRLYQQGAVNEKFANQVKKNFIELFYPTEEKWRLKAVQDADRAFEGILKAEGFIRNKS